MKKRLYLRKGIGCFYHPSLPLNFVEKMVKYDSVRKRFYIELPLSCSVKGIFFVPGKKFSLIWYKGKPMLMPKKTAEDYFSPENTEDD